jgi:hypothetical protein
MAAFFKVSYFHFSNEVEKYNIACNLLKKKNVNFIIHVIMIPVGIGLV